MKFTSCFITALLLVCFVNAQQHPTWKTSFSTEKAFIENQSQFNGRDLLPGSDVLFATENGACQVLFTKNGLTYRFDKKVMPDAEENEGQQEHDKFTWQTQVIHMQWQNANANVQLVAEELLPDYHNYSLGNKSINHVKAFKKLVYKNLYPGIDVEYVFHPAGIEYTLLLQPGADASMVKMNYSGASNMELNANLHISTIFGDMTDKAPVSFYAEKPESVIPSSFVLNGNRTVSFNLGQYDHTKHLIIDPWVVFPDSLPNSNKAFYIKTDSAGNAYVYGGDSPFRLKKYDANGILQWTFNTPWDTGSYWFGALAVDRAGNSYITAGSTAHIAKVSPTGNFVWQGASLGNPNIEYWAPAFTTDYSRLLVGGTKIEQPYFPPGAGFSGIVNEVDLNSGDSLRILTCAGHYIDSAIGTSFANPNEVRTLCSSPNGNFYFLTQDTIGAFDTAFNILYRHHSAYTFGYYPPFGLGQGQGQNAMAVSGNYIYTSNGKTLFKRLILTGNIIDSTNIPHGLSEMNYGLAVDSCENVYVGSQGHVYKYNNNFTLVDSASVTAAVYDVSVGPNGTIYACGNNFAAAVYLNSCSSHLTVTPTGVVVNPSSTSSTCAGSCNGSATATPVTGTPPFRYIWSPGPADTTQTITGLCAGMYCVTVTDLFNYSCTACCSVGQTPVPLQQLCMVTADSNSTENIVIWEKVNKYATDSFYLYRTPTPDTTYVLIAGFNRDSLSEYFDAAANPGLMSYRYKINLKDTCGDFSVLSNYHQTIFLTDSGNGIFAWVPYAIENTLNPVTGYSLYRDTTGAGNWQLVVSVGSAITTAHDPNYANYSNVRYKVVATMANPCTPSRSSGASVNSNIVNIISTGILNSSIHGEIKIYPNPNNGVFTLQSVGLTSGDYAVYDMLGNTITKSTITSNRQEIDLNTAAPGVYLLLVKGANISKAMRITIER